MPSSFTDPERTFGGMPADIGVLLRQVDVASGRQELYEDQLPELLRGLAEQTRVESIRASNAIEGVEVDPDRAEKLAQAERPRLRNRNEKEFAGYADAIDALMRDDALQPITAARLLIFHSQIFKHTRARGGYLKTEDNVIAGRDQHGRRYVIFEPPPWQQTEGLLLSLCGSYEYALDNEVAHPLVLLAAFILDLLAIHPVADGNGRVSRLATTQELLRLGYGVARYVSVEQRIYESKNGYYQALEESQRDWHEAEHTIWPWTRYFIGVLGEAYADFEARVAGARGEAKMNKQDRIRHWIENAAADEFRISDIRKAVPGVSDPTIRIVLGAMREEDLLAMEGTGAGAHWTKRPGV